jgi:eukaryotic-like serine/threonine-protein kinase
MNRLEIKYHQHSIAGRKLRNDDSYGIVVPVEAPLLHAKGIAIAIADGMSASEGAKEASETCVRSFLEDYYATHESWPVKRSVAAVLKAVNSWLYAQGQRSACEERGMVTTFSGLVLKSGMLHLFHAGDSRVYRWRAGSLEQLTNDHRIRIARGLEHLSRAFGISANLELDYREETLEQGDIYVLSTDGMHDWLPSADIARLAQDDAEPAKAIVDAALLAGSDDNVTCQVISIISPGPLNADGHRLSAQRMPFPKIMKSGDTLDGFTIVRPIHESSRSQVYLAKDNSDGSLKAIKTPSPNFEDDTSYIEAFAREEWIGRMVVNPNVLSFHDVTGKRGSLYHVTEYFEGKTLQQWMLDNPIPDFESVRAIVGQVVSGLRAMHRKDILHLDLKPGNIMIDSDGWVKLIDFGSSFASAGDAATVAGGAPAGTVDYAAPEHLQGARPTNRSDIFSLGVIAYEMLTGHLPYGKGLANAASIKRAVYVPAAARRKDIPDWMDAALEESVRTGPAERTDALSAFAENLRKPNSALGFGRERPLIERNPVAFWKGVSFVLALMIFGLALLTAFK